MKTRCPTTELVFVVGPVSTNAAKPRGIPSGDGAIRRSSFHYSIEVHHHHHQLMRAFDAAHAMRINAAAAADCCCRKGTLCSLFEYNMENHQLQHRLPKTT